MASNIAFDSARQARRTPARGEHPAGVEWAVLHRSHGLCVADVAQGLSAEGHGVLLLQGIPPRRHVGTHSRLGKEASTRETWKTTSAQRGDHRQSIGKNNGKKGICCGYDAGKKVKGRKRHLLVDTLGLVWGLVVHAADVQDRDGAKLLLKRVQRRFSRLKLIWADGGYAGQLIGWVQQICGWVLEIVKRSDDVAGFAVLPKRWIVERTFGWFGWYRRLSKDYEELTENSEAMILVCMIHRMLRHLKPAELAAGWEM
jgi:transposase